MSKKILPCLILAAVLLVNAAILPTFCSYEKVLSLEITLNGVMPGLDQSQLRYVADKLAVYLTSEDYTFVTRGYTAEEVFTGDVKIITLLALILRDLFNTEKKHRTLENYQDTGTITSDDAIYGSIYSEKLQRDPTASSYYSDITWNIVYSESGSWIKTKKFTITVTDTEHPENTYTRVLNVS